MPIRWAPPSIIVPLVVVVSLIGAYSLTVSVLGSGSPLAGSLGQAPSSGSTGPPPAGSVPANSSSGGCTYPANSSCPHTGGPPLDNASLTFVLNYSGSSGPVTGVYTYDMRLSYATRGVQASDAQFGISGVNTSTGVDGPLGVDFTLAVEDSNGAVVAIFDSAQSQWGGTSWNGSFATLGGWVVGSGAALNSGYVLSISIDQPLSWGAPIPASAPSWDDVLVTEMYAASTGGSIQEVPF